MYPNSDPGMFWVAFYGCLLAEVIPVPIEVPLSRKVWGAFGLININIAFLKYNSDKCVSVCFF